MAKYIDVENYCKNICRCAKKHCDKNKCPTLTASTADVVEVVRCKDCKHSRIDDVYVIKKWCWKHYITIKDDNDFCSYGERRAND